MEMGTGKSRTVIELAKIRAHKIDRVVWLCPVSLKETVRQEIFKHTDCRDVYVFDDKTDSASLPPDRWFVVGIESLGGSDRVTLALKAAITTDTMVIVDESSYIKGHGAKRTNRVTILAEVARYRMILTGTPLSQGVEDLFAQMRFLSPKILGYNSFYSFAANHLEYSKRYPGMIVDAHNKEHLAAKIAPYVYQVTKSECLDLPEKIYKRRYVSLSSDQRYFYEMAKRDILLDLEPDDITSVTIFRLFTALQSIVCGFWNRRMSKEERAEKGTTARTDFMTFPESRMSCLEEIIEDIPEGEKVIVWAKFRFCIDAIERMLKGKHGNSSVALFHGGLSEKERTRQIDLFRGEARFLVATQSAGGHGLTLNEASHVVFYADGFKYSERLQAEDRCHRIGQGRSVIYHTIEAMDSIDDRISDSLSKKGNALTEFRKEVQKVRREGSKEDLERLVMKL